MAPLATHRSNHRVASLHISQQVRAAYQPEVLDQLASTWSVSETVAEEMLARLVGPDYRRWQAQAARCGFCARPIRLRGRVLDGDGEVVFDTASEPDGVLLKRCQNRRRSVCPSCSFQYAGDLWHLLHAGLAGGDKGVPPEVHDHPMVFVTLTAPGFGPVHSTRQRNGKPRRCRPRREAALCPHGRPRWCMAVHQDHDRKVGTPICPDCYDYPAEPEEDTTLLVGEWRFAGVGYTTDGDAKLAAFSEASAREWRPYIAQAINDERRERESWTGV